MPSSSALDTAALLELDRAHVWHPYTALHDPLPVYPIVGAKGVHLELADGRQLIDGMSSWWTAIHGYNVPELNAAAQAQLNRMAHVMFGGITHEPAVKLAHTLASIAPGDLDKVFFCDSGSVAVEVAVKMAVQYQQALGHADKTELLTIRGGYHGDTFKAMSVCDPVTGMHHLFSGAVQAQHFADRPTCRFGAEWDPRDVASFQTLLETNHTTIAAVILEPVVQGAGGMWFYHPEYLRQVRQLCDHYGVLLIADEIATGFGRTGRLFAVEHAGIVPDILCVGKALTGGYVSLAAAITTEKVSEGIATKEPGVFMHGPTFMGNPLSCAIANASIDLLLQSPWASRVAEIEDQLRKELEPARALPGVRDVRTLGAIGVVELEAPVDVAAAQREFVEAGVWIRPFGRLVYIMPPYVIEPEDLRQLTAAMLRLLQ